MKYFTMTGFGIGTCFGVLLVALCQNWSEPPQGFLSVMIVIFTLCLASVAQIESSKKE